MDRLGLVASRRFGALSPLRYPGGKSVLAGLFADILQDLALRAPRYIEPYAGGAGAGIALLRYGIVENLVINDIDPAVYAFWRAVVDHNEQFVEMLKTVPLSVSEWRRQRAIYNARDPSNLVSLGFAFFYLNRTNRSGVLNAGVIGGQDQTGNYKMDARFNREMLSKRLEAIGSLADRITVSDLDGRTVIQQYDDPSSFIYIDPPYVQAGSKLYLNSFDGRDHRALAEIVNGITSAQWLITYDMAPLIEGLYAEQFKAILELNYSAHHTGRAQELLIASPTVANSITKIRSLAVHKAVTGA